MSCEALVERVARLATENPDIAHLYGRPGKDPRLTPLVTSRELHACKDRDPEGVLEALYDRTGRSAAKRERGHTR